MRIETKGLTIFNPKYLKIQSSRRHYKNKNDLIKFYEKNNNKNCFSY